MYLAPFVGLGIGFVVTSIVSLLIARFGQRQSHSLGYCLAQGGASYAGVLIVFAILVAPRTALNEPFHPALPTQVVSSLGDLGSNLPPAARIWTWWDTGFLIPYVAGASVYHDGGAQKSPQTYFVAKSLVSDRQKVLHNVVSFIDARGNRGIAELVQASGSRLAGSLEIVNNSWPLRHDAVFVIFTADMIAKYPALHGIGAWDFDTGAAAPSGILNLGCTGRSGDLLECRGSQVNLRTGMVDEAILLQRAEFIEHGQVIHGIEYPGANRRGYLQILVQGKQPYAVYLLDAAAYASNFNQMFLLGRFDEQLFEEFYNRFPAVRAFRVKAGRVGADDRTGPAARSQAE
jgi:dolichyl-diphosphooligosaccharide--protein glycosyltransferase